MKVEVIDGAHAIGTADALLLCLWRGVTTREAIEQLRKVAMRLVDERGRISMLTVVEAEADMPDSAVRGDLAELFKALADNVDCSALVFEGEGFRAATVRGITTGINLLARQPFPHKVFGTVGAAGAWMSGHVVAHLSTDGVVRDLADLRATLDEKRPESVSPSRR